MKIGHNFGFASGKSRADCHVLGYRFDEEIGFQPDAGESWIIRLSGTKVSTLFSFVASEDEIYACGHGKDLLQGSVHGWVRVLAHTAPLRAVVKWKGDVWVATGGDEGLSQLKDGKLVSVKPNIKATQIDARGDLLITCPDKIANSSDGKKFTGTLVTELESLTKDERPAWD
jgi:hypothetical protein